METPRCGEAPAEAGGALHILNGKKFPILPNIGDEQKNRIRSHINGGETFHRVSLSVIPWSPSSVIFC